jgi:hypothetical protein
MALFQGKVLNNVLFAVTGTWEPEWSEDFEAKNAKRIEANQAIKADFEVHQPDPRFIQMQDKSKVRAV